MLAFAEGAEEGVVEVEIFEALFDHPLGVDEGDDEVWGDEVADDAVVFEFAVDAVPFDGGWGADDDVFVAVALDVEADFFVFAFAGEFEDVVGGGEEALEGFFAAFGEFVDGVVYFDVAVVVFSYLDDFLDVGGVVHAGEHSGDEDFHGANDKGCGRRCKCWKG